MKWEGHCRLLSRLYFPPKRSSCSEIHIFGFSFQQRHWDGLIILPWGRVPGGQCRKRVEKNITRRRLYCRKKVRDICGNLLGEGGSQMSNFLTNAVRARYSRVNHDVPLKDYMWHVLDVHVVLAWNIHCLEHVKYWIWKERSHCKARGALSHSGLGALSPLDFWLRLLLWSRCGFLVWRVRHRLLPDSVVAD